MAAQTWFVVRDGKEEGPFTGTALKDMVASGKLKPTDQVRRADVETGRPASQIKGLFPESGLAERTSGKAQPPELPQPATNKKKWLVIGSVVAAVLFLSCAGLVGLGLFVSQSERKEAQKSYTEANELWDAGKKDEAAGKYRSALKGLRGEERALAYGRLIDHECEKGNTEAARTLAADAAKAKVTPTVSHPDAKSLLTTGQVSGQQPGGSAVAQGDVLTAEFYPHQPGTKQQVIGPLYIAKGQAARFRKEYTHEPGGVIAVRWLRNAGPQGQDLPIPKPRKVQHRQKDGFIEIGEENETLRQTLWHPVVKLGAKVGDEWEREVIPGMKEKYKLVGFGEPKWGLKDIDFDGAGKKGKVHAARIEVRIVSDLGGGKTVVDTEEIELGQGVGPVSRQSFRGEKEGRQTNWTETLVKPQKN